MRYHPGRFPFGPSSIPCWIVLILFLAPACGRDEPPSPAGDAGSGAAGFVDSESGDDADRGGDANRNRDGILFLKDRAAQPELGGILNIRIPSDPATLNNMTRTGTFAAMVDVFLYPRLLQTDPDTYELLPFAAASRPTRSEDRKTVTWTLREGIRWHDFETSGARLSSRDVKFSFDLLKDPVIGPARVAQHFKHLAEIRVIDELTFEAVYEKPLPDAVYRFGVDFRILPAHLLEDVPRAEIKAHPISREPVGYGPFRFKHWRRGDEVLIVRFDDNLDFYPERFRPRMDGIRWRIIPDGKVMYTQFLRGEIDLCSLTPDDYVLRADDAEFDRMGTRHRYDVPYWNYIAWNNRSPLFEDKRVRRALTHLVRRAEILKSHLHGMARLLSGPLFYYSKGYDHAIEPLPFDPETAKTLLAEAGWADTDEDGILDRTVEGKKIPFAFEFLVTSSGGYVVALVEAFKEDLRKVGIKLTMRRLEWSAFLDRVSAFEYDAFTLGFRAQPVFEDPFGKWHSSQDREGGNNRAGYRNPEADRLLEAIRDEFDEEKRYALLRTFHALMHEDQPFTFLYSLNSLVGINRRWRNVIIHRTGPLFYEWWLPSSERTALDEVPH